MSDLEAKPNTDKAEKPAEKHASKSFDAEERNVDAAKVKEAHLTNRDHHSGSAGGDQEHSIEIVGFDAVVSRKTKLTEKDIKEPTRLKGHIEENTMSPQAVLETIAALPLDKQAQILGAGVAAFQNELEHQKFRIFVGAVAGIGDGTVSLAKGVEETGKAICEVAQFGREIMANDPAAVDKAGKAGEAIGKTLVGGVHLFQVADAYLGNIGATGDYCKPFKDIAWLGQKINDNWQAMSPEEKTRLTTKLAVENLGAMAVGLGTNKLAKSMDVAGALEQLGTDASQLGGAARDKASKFISRMTEELAPQEVGLTADGQLAAIPKRSQITPDVVLNQAKRENIMLSQADDLGEAGAPRLRDADAEIKATIEKFPPSEKFVSFLNETIENLHPDELEYMAENNLKIKPVRRISDIYPNRDHATLGIYDPSNRTIFIAEEVLSLGRWQQNFDVAFELRHEFGHALNATLHPLGDWISDRPAFIKAFQKDFSKLSMEQKRDLRLSPEYRSDICQVRDEVFADVYGHASGFKSNHSYSQKMKLAFPSCLNYIQTDLFK